MATFQVTPTVPNAVTSGVNKPTARNCQMVVLSDGEDNLVTLTGGALSVTGTVQPLAATNVYFESSLAITASGTSANFATSNFTSLFASINVTAVSGTAPTLTVSLQMQDANANWFTLATTPTISANGIYVLAVGPGLINNYPIMNTARLSWTIGGTTPSFTVQRGLQGK